MEDAISQQVQLLSIVEESRPTDSDSCKDDIEFSRDANNNVIEPSVENNRTESEGMKLIWLFFELIHFRQ